MTKQITYKVEIKVGSLKQTVTVTLPEDASQLALKKAAIEQWQGNMPDKYIQFTWEKTSDENTNCM